MSRDWPGAGPAVLFPAMRIAQLTDPHIRRALPGTAGPAARESRRAGDLLPAALKQIESQKPDVLVVTGDLLDVPIEPLGEAPDGRDDDPTTFAQAVDDYAYVREALERTGLPYLVLPGNHDRSPAMWRVFDAAATQRTVNGVRLIAFHDREHDGHVPHRVGAQRRQFEACLAGAAALPQVHLQHYVITPALNADYPHTYADGESLTAQIVASGRVRLALSGHYHDGTDLIRHEQRETCTWFATGAAFCVAPFPWRLYEWDGPAQAVAMRTFTMADR